MDRSTFSLEPHTAMTMKKVGNGLTKMMKTLPGLPEGEPLAPAGLVGPDHLPWFKVGHKNGRIVATLLNDEF